MEPVSPALGGGLPPTGLPGASGILHFLKIILENAEKGSRRASSFVP